MSFQGKLILDSDLFRLEFTETIPFNENVEKGDEIEKNKVYCHRKFRPLP